MRKRMIALVTACVLLTACSGNANKQDSENTVADKTAVPTESMKPITTEKPLETVILTENIENTEETTNQAIRITENYNSLPEYAKEYAEDVIDVKGNLNKEFCNEIVQINFWGSSSLYQIKDSEIISKILDLLDSTIYHEIEPITDPVLMRAGGTHMDLITNNAGYVFCLMQGDQMIFGKAPNDRWYKVEQNVTSPIHELVAQYLGWED